MHQKARMKSVPLVGNAAIQKASFAHTVPPLQFAVIHVRQNFRQSKNRNTSPTMRVFHLAQSGIKISAGAVKMPPAAAAAHNHNINQSKI